MQYQDNVVYHIYNQSINFEPIFRSEENYLFFLKKVRTHLLPVADILCYCLMPDHFHFMIMPTAHGCSPSTVRKAVRHSQLNETKDEFQQMLSQQLKVLLSSYARAFNRRYHRRGSLFRAKTKARPAYQNFLPDHLMFNDETHLTELVPYLKICFEYIHDNPVKAGYAISPEEWQFSSAGDYLGKRNGTLCSYAIAERLIGIKKQVYIP